MVREQTDLRQLVGQKRTMKVAQGLLKSMDTPRGLDEGVDCDRVCRRQVCHESLRTPNRILQQHASIVLRLHRASTRRYPSGMRAHMLLDGEGNVLGLSEDREQAIAMARRLVDDDHIYYDGPTDIEEAILDGEPAADLDEPLDLAANASADAPALAMRALRKGGFNLAWSDVESMTLEEAHERLMPLFPRARRGLDGIHPVKAYQTPLGMSRQLLGQNMKSGKEAPPSVIRRLKAATGHKEAIIVGLSLLPNNMAYSSPMVADIVSRGRRDYGIRIVDHATSLSKGRDPVRVNLCTKATAECIASCLTFSGQNLNDDYNTIRKFSATQALVREPAAFVRMLVSAIQRHEYRCRTADAQALIRLNVYSDIPWELACPELIQRFPGVQFYDYTKVPGRTPDALGLSNYDLTFSFSGSQANVDAMEQEIRDRKRRVAVVFAARGLATHDYLDKTGELRVAKGTEIPTRAVGYKTRGGRGQAFPARFTEPFLGLEVVDGDESDLRPYDPTPCIVGLRWKPPITQAVSWSQAEIFVVEVTIVPSGRHFDAIIAKTPRFDGVDFSDLA